MNALFRCGDVVLRVGRTTADPALAHELATVLAGHGVPVLRAQHGCAGWYGGFGVSAWEYVPAESGPIGWEAVGAAVRRVHSIPADVIPDEYPVPSPTTFPWWDFDGLLADVQPDIDVEALAGLRRAVEHHRGWTAKVTAESLICHGDVHPGNVLQSSSGPLVIDWDLMCRAPAAWDHAMLITYAERWGGDPSVYAQFTTGYGRSYGDDELALALGQLRNVAATLMRVRAGRTDARAAVEAERRLRYWRGDPDPPIWQSQ